MVTPRSYVCGNLQRPASPRSLRTLQLLLLAVCIVGRESASAQRPWITDAAPSRYFAAHGTRGLLGGNNAEGVEAYVYPLQLFRGLRVDFLFGRSETLVLGQSWLRHNVYAPTYIERRYEHKQFTVTERLSMAPDQPGGTIEYTVESPEPVAIVLSFVPVLDLMWPGGIGGQEIHWESALNAYLLNEPTRNIVGLLGSPDVSLHETFENTNSPKDSETRLHLRLGPGKHVRVFFAATTKGYEDVEAVFKKLGADPDASRAAAELREAKRREQALEIVTPDLEVNEALAWDELAMDDFWACNPDLGCGLVGGYGPSRGIARRPQYAWFFAGDGLVSLPAILEAGYFERAKEELLFLLRYQDKESGMMWHELSQSAGHLRWNEDYPYAFAHADITPAFITGAAQYVRATGDLALVRLNWRNFTLAYGYVTGLLDPQDGLPRIPNGKVGHDEQEHPSQELAMAFDCLLASRDFAYLAEMTGHIQDAEGAVKAAQRMEKAIVPRFWNTETKFWNSGLTGTGTPTKTVRLPPAESLELLSSAQRAWVLDRVEGRTFQTAWGVRTVATDSAKFTPGAYATGSVWGKTTSEAAAMFWRNGRPDSAWVTWRKLLPWLRKDSAGFIHEAMSGEQYVPQKESVPEQTWSSALMFSSFIEGVLGIHYDGVSAAITLRPCLPREWRQVEVHRLRVGEAVVDLKMQRTGDSLAVTARTAKGAVWLSLAANLVARGHQEAMTLNGHPCGRPVDVSLCSLILQP